MLHEYQIDKIAFLTTSAPESAENHYEQITDPDNIPYHYSVRNSYMMRV